MKYSDYGNWKAEGLEDAVTAGQHLMEALSRIAKTGDTLLRPNNEIVRLLTGAVSHIAAAAIQFGFGEKDVEWNDSGIYNETSKFGHLESIVSDFTNGLLDRGQTLEDGALDSTELRWAVEETEELLADLKQYARLFFDIDLEVLCEHLKAKNTITREIHQLKKFAEDAVLVYHQPLTHDGDTGRNNHADALEALNDKAVKLQEKWHDEFPDFIDQPIPSSVNVRETDDSWIFSLDIKTIWGGQSALVRIDKQLK